MTGFCVCVCVLWENNADANRAATRICVQFQYFFQHKYAVRKKLQSVSVFVYFVFLKMYNYILLFCFIILFCYLKND